MISYHLVICYIAIENGPVEIVSFPINSMVDLSHQLCKRLPEGKSPLYPNKPLYISWYPYISPINSYIIHRYTFNSNATQRNEGLNTCWRLLQHWAYSRDSARQARFSWEWLGTQNQQTLLNI